jgi:hypothetical protein
VASEEGKLAPTPTLETNSYQCELVPLCALQCVVVSSWQFFKLALLGLAISIALTLAIVGAVAVVDLLLD